VWYYTRHKRTHMLFHKRTKTIVKWLWALVSILIIISMVFTFSSGF
jgi:hypothetical protein